MDDFIVKICTADFHMKGCFNPINGCFSEVCFGSYFNDSVANVFGLAV